MPRIIELRPDKATQALRDHHAAFSGGPCNACKGACCVHCANVEGYHYNKALVKDLKEKYGFDNKTGFQTEQGCRIPVHERSSTCVAYQCRGYDNSWRRDRDLTPTPWPPAAGPRWVFSDEQRVARMRLSDAVSY